MLILRKQELQVKDILVGDQIKVGKYTATCQTVMEGKAVFMLDQYLDKPYSMNSNMTNNGGYEKSELCAEIKNAECDTNFNAIRDKLIPFGNSNLLRIPTVGEMFGTDKQRFDGFYEMDDARQWILMKNQRNRIADRNGEVYEWGWLQNKAKNSVSHFANVDNNGRANYSGAAHSGGVRPVFQLVC